MKTIIIYGIGQCFENLFAKDNLIKEILQKMDVEIIGFIDKQKKGMEIVYNDKKYVVMSPDHLFIEDKTKIIVTSNKFYKEIKEELMIAGIQPEQVEFINDFIKPILCNMYHVELFQNKAGLEIGGPSDIFENIYEICKSCDGVNFNADTVWWQKDSELYTYKGKKLGKIMISDATNMENIPDDSYEFVMSSNNLEHIANPLKAVKEFKRVAKKNAMILIVVPRKERTFDHNRPDTSFEHMLEDYKKEIGEEDNTHLPEILKLHDYEKDPGCGGKEAFKIRAKDNINNRCLHHHVFNKRSLTKIYTFFDIKVVDIFEAFNNYWIIGKK